MEEIPNSEKVFKADLVIIAAGFLGPEKTLAEQFGLKKVSPLCFYLMLCRFSIFLGVLWIISRRTPEVILLLKRTSFWPVFPKCMPQEVRFPSTFACNSILLALIFLSIFSTSSKELACQMIWALGRQFVGNQNIQTKLVCFFSRLPPRSVTNSDSYFWRKTSGPSDRPRPHGWNLTGRAGRASTQH